MPVTEGTTTLPIDPDKLSGGSVGPGTHDRDRPFYNPAMQVNRDLSLMVVEAWAKRRGRQLDVADVLAGAGARSLRLANEVQADIVVHANDGDPNGIRTLEKGREALGIAAERLATTRGNAHMFLSSRRYDIVDIDPFGSPMPLLDSAMRSVRHDGLLCLTATDTAALSGTYPRVCRRRYGAWHGLHKMPWRAEVGLRILTAAAVRSGGRFERGVRPILSVSQGHWMRVFLHVVDGRDHADKAQRSLGQAWGDEARMGHLGPRAPDGDWAGDLWTGPMHDAATLAQLSLTGHMEARTQRLLPVLQAEADAPPFWGAIPHMNRVLGHDMPKKPAIMARLRDAGFVAAPSHMDPEGIRTDASWEQIRPLLLPQAL